MYGRSAVRAPLEHAASTRGEPSPYTPAPGRYSCRTDTITSEQMATGVCLCRKECAIYGFTQHQQRYLISIVAPNAARSRHVGHWLTERTQDTEDGEHSASRSTCFAP